MSRIHAVTLFSGLLAVASLAPAQTAVVSGTVTDPSGARNVGAAISAINVSTGVATPSSTNEAGVYVFPSLPTGKYRIIAEHTGFRKAVIDDLDLDLGAKLTVDISMTLGASAETVEVKANTSEVKTSSVSVGEVVNGKKLLDLPLAGRSAYDLVTTQPGVIGGANINTSSSTSNIVMNGNRGGSVNFSMDGINAQNNLLSGSFYLYSNVVSVDRAEEFRVVTSSADVEYGRGSGQIQMITRAGSNAFHGSAFYELRNTALNGNDWFNNARGNDASGNPISPRNVLVQNNYGIRLGGPIKRNRTFFNGIYEPYKQRQANAFTATVFTPAARQGIVRFFPNFLNGNATAAVPTVDLSGNPVAPAGAGALQSISVFGRDPNRLSADPTGIITHQLSFMPLPNNFRAGDGLNTAGFTWSRPVPVNFELYEGRIDHTINDKHRLYLVLSQQSYHSFNVATPPPYPAVPGNVNPTETTQYSAALTSVVRANLLNEVKIGVFRPRTLVLTPFDKNQPGSEGLLPKAGSTPFILLSGAGVTNPVSGNESNYIAPVYQYGDSLTWIKGRHSFKAGVELRLISDSGYDANNVTPSVQIGSGAFPVANINTIAGIGGNSGTASGILLDLTGSLSSATQTLNSPGGAKPAFIPGETRFREWHQNEFSGYFKDDFKITPSFTINVGVRYELYSAPREGQGKMITPMGGGAGAFGISGTSFATAEFHPGTLSGSPTQVINIGEGTANPGVPLYNTDKNNFAPGVGFSWSLPWFGKNKTIVRGGYGIGYERLPIYLTHNNSGLEPGLSSITAYIPGTLFNLGNLQLPVQPTGLPLAAVPTSGPGSHSQTLFSFDNNLRTPYSQNFNFSIQRELGAGTTLTVSYVGSKGSKLARSIDVNEVNVFENGLLQAFQTLQAGGTSPLMEQIFGAGGSASLRANSSVTGLLANNNVGGFANFINTTNQVTGIVGGLLAKAGLPANFVVANPQFAASYLTGNFSNSSYHSLQVQASRRFSRGLTLQSSYVWSKNLGDEEGDGSTLQSSYRTLRNERLDKRRTSYDHRHVFKVNGLYELPFGRGKTFGGNVNGFFDRIIGGWQIGAIFNLYTGQPITLSAQNTFNAYGLANALEQFTPNALGPVPSGAVTKVGNGVVYFDGLTQINDPYIANLTTNGNIRALSTLKAIATSGGAPLLVNPVPGQIGNLGLGALTGPGFVQLDMNLIKRIRINERFTLQLGASARNVTNSVNFANPTTSINSTSFGRITGTNGVPRILVLQGRVNF